MDGSLVVMEGSLSLRFLLLQWIVALSIWKVVCYGEFVTSMDGRVVIMEGSSFLIFFNSNEWYPCHYGR